MDTLPIYLIGRVPPAGPPGGPAGPAGADAIALRISGGWAHVSSARDTGQAGHAARGTGHAGHAGHAADRLPNDTAAWRAHAVYPAPGDTFSPAAIFSHATGKQSSRSAD